MVVALCRLVFLLRGNHSLKGKRSVARRLIERSRQRFNLAVAEVDEADDHQRLVIGLAALSNDARHANAVVDKAVAFMSTLSEAMLIERKMDLQHMNPSTMASSLASSESQEGWAYLEGEEGWNDERG